MGTAMARRVARAGHTLTVWNRTSAAAQAVADGLAAEGAAGVTVAPTAADAVRAADVVLSMLADGRATRDVLLDTAVLRALTTDHRHVVVCDLATSGVDAATALAEGLAGVGALFVDAPVSGSVPSVEAGTLLVMASGEP
jgi:3-hydroxyisobutyrate dehydrogenase-like beta-hydroxyacid dehydrogenase